jgi:prepilin-type N-terminal cleavage/methylation domain-containing protein
VECDGLKLTTVQLFNHSTILQKVAEPQHSCHKQRWSYLGLTSKTNVKDLLPYSPIALLPFKKAAFTLAEVLITLGIIGVVAALTLPPLLRQHTEQATVSKVKKMYSTLANAYNLYLTEENPPLVTTENEAGATAVANVFLPYLNVSKDCGTQNGANCIYNGTYKLKNGKSTYNYAANARYYKLIISDGSTIWFRGHTNGDDQESTGVAFYDVNGKNPPNQWGYDLFAFDIRNNKVIPFSNFTTNCAPANSKGWSCATWILQKGNMDYLRRTDLSL